MRVLTDHKGRVTIPKSIRKELGVGWAAVFEVESIAGSLVLRPVREPGAVARAGGLRRMMDDMGRVSVPEQVCDELHLNPDAVFEVALIEGAVVFRPLPGRLFEPGGNPPHISGG